LAPPAVPVALRAPNPSICKSWLRHYTNQGLTFLYKFKMTHHEVDVTDLMNFIMLFLSPGPDGIDGFLLMQHCFILFYFFFHPVDRNEFGDRCFRSV
jgi:hypothetical protein